MIKLKFITNENSFLLVVCHCVLKRWSFKRKTWMYLSFVFWNAMAAFVWHRLVIIVYRGGYKKGRYMYGMYVQWFFFGYINGVFFFLVDLMSTANNALICHRYLKEIKKKNVGWKRVNLYFQTYKLSYIH